MDHRRINRRTALLRIMAAGMAATATVPILGACGGQPGSPLATSAAHGVPGATTDPSGQDTTADTIMIIRHAEKPTGKNAPFGIDRNGNQSAGSLTVQGWARAGALAELLDRLRPEPIRQGLTRPTDVYAAKPDGDASQRPSQTVAPLAARLGVTVNTLYGKGDEAALAKEITARHGAILVSWQHEEIPAIVHGLGAVHPAAPAIWPDDRFDL